MTKQLRESLACALIWTVTPVLMVWPLFGLRWPVYAWLCVCGVVTLIKAPK